MRWRGCGRTRTAGAGRAGGAAGTGTITTGEPTAVAAGLSISSRAPGAAARGVAGGGTAVERAGIRWAAGIAVAVTSASVTTRGWAAAGNTEGCVTERGVWTRRSDTGFTLTAPTTTVERRAQAVRADRRPSRLNGGAGRRWGAGLVAGSSSMNFEPRSGLPSSGPAAAGPRLCRTAGGGPISVQVRRPSPSIRDVTLLTPPLALVNHTRARFHLSARSPARTGRNCASGSVVVPRTGLPRPPTHLAGGLARRVRCHASSKPVDHPDSR